MTMTLISTVTVGSGGAASIDFTSIAGTYTDLQIVLSVRSTGSTNREVYIRPNGLSTNLTARYLEGSGASAYSGTIAGFVGTACSSAGTSNTFSNISIYLPNYAGATNKSYSVDSVEENNATTAYQDIVAGLWSSTAAITSISIVLGASSFAQYSTASLYGILKGSGGATVS